MNGLPSFKINSSSNVNGEAGGEISRNLVLSALELFGGVHKSPSFWT